MSVLVKDFDKGIKKYILKSDSLQVSVLEYGATVDSIIFNGKDICLGFDDLAGYKANTSFQGATVGRYANRIAAGKFTLNGTEYDVGCNEDGRGHLHGGKIGLDKKLWQAEIISQEPACVRFTNTLVDGEEGYPGNMSVSVTFTIEGATWKLKYEATTDKDTVFNPTNHTYFNLNGYDGESVLSTELKLNASAITPVNEMLIPTGELMPVEGTAFDFNEMKPIGRDIEDTHPQMLLGGGYDHNFVLGKTREMRHAAKAVSPITKIVMDCYTDMPGIQLYTANTLGEPTGKSGKPLSKNGGFCLETQFFPDTPNKPQFPSAVLKKGETFVANTKYCFSIKG